MDTIQVRIADLTLDPGNAVVHGPENVARIAKSLSQFGQQTPIVVDADNVVLKGNGTTMAALELGWTELKAVRSDLAGPERLAYMLADNKTSDDHEYDPIRLAQRIREIQSEEDEALLEATGFTDEDATRLLEAAADELAGVEILPELPDIEVSTSHQVTVRYTDDDEAAIREFIGQEGEGPLSPQLGVLILGRIKDLASA